MAFTTRRGRPPRTKFDALDHGTPELQLKRALGATSEPIDTCLERNLITPDQHWCSLHLRWLYTLRYGAPVVTTRYVDMAPETGQNAPSAEWRCLRELEYHDIVGKLHNAVRYEPVMRVCVFNEMPCFLSQTLVRRSWKEPGLADQLQRNFIALKQGLDILVDSWRPKRQATVRSMPQTIDYLAKMPM